MVANNHRWWSGTLAALVAAALLSVPANDAGAVTTLTNEAGEAGADLAAGTVTLVTGDRVTLTGDGKASVVPDPAREDIHFITYQRLGQTYVLPNDAMPLLEDGRLDWELFNVSALVDAGYDEAGSEDLPLLVTRSNGLRGDARTRLTQAGVRVTGELASAEAFTVRAGHADLAGFWQSVLDGDLARGSTVWLDRMVQPVLADSVPQVGAPAAWAAGFDGTGVTVAVLDTGVDTGHPDLAGKVVGTENFTSENALDTVGHGTHVASTIAGTGAASGGANRGVAPGASLLSGKICERRGCPFSAIIAGLDWAVAQGADVVNLSLSGNDSPGVDPLEEAINNLTASSDTLFVAAAGNVGRQRFVGTPGTADAALSVGAVDGADQLATFSSQGPRPGDSALKPDITAPGVAVTAARSQHSFLAGSAYTTLQGTSMATPHVAGAAAILAQRNPGWSAELLKAALMGSADPNPSVNSYAQGAGRLAVDDAINQSVVADPPSVSLGAFAQDPTPGSTIVRTVTYRNHGTANRTLNLALSATGPTGGAAPAGMFSLSASSVTVPAGGEASVTLTTGVGTAVPSGIYTGRITATGGGQEVQTPFGIDRLAKLTLTHTGRTGNPPIAFSEVFLPVDGHGAYPVNNFPGTFEGWLPAGTYVAHNWTFDIGPSGPEETILVIPRLDVTSSRAIHFDARLGQPLSITVPDPAAQLLNIEVGSQLDLPGVGFMSVVSQAQSPTAFMANIGTATNLSGYLAKISARHWVPGTSGFENAPRSYHTAWFLENQHPTGFVRNVAANRFATVDARQVPHIVDNGITYKVAFADPGGTFFSAGFGISLPIRPPFNRTEFYHSEGNVRWRTSLEEWQEVENADDLLLGMLRSPSIGYTAGTSQVQWWNRPVYGANLAAPLDPIGWVTRVGDSMLVQVPLFGDGDGHANFTAVTDGRLRLTRGSQVLYDLPFSGGEELVVPPEFSTYQLTASAERGAPFTLSTRVNARWTFSSQTVNGGFPLRLPLWSVQATPPLDTTGTAPKGVPFSIPLRAQAQPGSAAAGLRALTVQYSVNDGVTWQNATVSPAGGGHVAQLTHPNLTGFVSLRLTATDWTGNSVEQDVIRAYRIG
jgi:subtilisin family serine protease